MARSKKTALGADLTAKGFFRLAITENKDGKEEVVSKTPWLRNLITNGGYSNYIVQSVGSIAGSSQIGFAAIGTGTSAPAATDTSLQGEITDVAGMRVGLTPTVVSTKTLQFTGQLASNLITQSKSIGNIGLFDRSNTNAGTVACEQTYATSQLNTNQTLNITYQIRFS